MFFFKYGFANVVFRYRIPAAGTHSVLTSRVISNACVQLATNLDPANTIVSTSMNVTSDRASAATAHAAICKVAFSAFVIPDFRWLVTETIVSISTNVNAIQTYATTALASTPWVPTSVSAIKDLNSVRTMTVRVSNCTLYSSTINKNIFLYIQSLINWF